ncbi:MAG: hypothetical protein K0S23_2321 [Fluviicola sp.]|jgi:hypothetical protein|uniref:hypothetical protein n=1 Tax=Fluviicola sp. TaxID=1917219 RepID=UPI0026091433|nr:hypothetical protein [Fluviicola sp.]MDF3028014.1 hypothetical protein [Fluviicola sp.]
MAKQIGRGITGRVDDYSFYHDRVHGYLVRRTGGVSSKEYQTDERYAAARNASAEFAAVSSAGKLIRDAFAPFIDQVKDGTMVNRMNKELVALKQADTKHCRGERRAEAMMTDTDANKFFRIFQFNEQVKVYELFEGLPTINASDTSLSLAPARNVNLLESAFPEGATHAGLTLVRSIIDFEKGRFETSSSRMGLVSKAEVSHWQEKQKVFSHRCTDEDGAYQSPVFFQKELSLYIEVSENLSSVSGTEIVCLQVLFFEERNGDFVQLKGKVHGMGVVEINKLNHKEREGHKEQRRQLRQTSRRIQRVRMRRNVRLSDVLNRSSIIKQKREIEIRGG